MRWFLPLLLAAILAGCAPMGDGFPRSMELLPVDRRTEPLRARHLDGKVTVVTFFHPACMSCHVPMRAVEETVDAIRESDTIDAFEALDLVSIYVVAGGRDRRIDLRDEVRTYLNHHELNQPAYWDYRGWLSDRVPSTAMSTYVFDREGRLVYSRRDAMQVSTTAARQLEDAILEAL